MAYKALYREWRPKNFEEMVGQRHITKVLRNQIENNKTGHAYLFCGTRGTGKTSAAKILAMGVNCLCDENKPCGVCENCISIQNEKSMDVIEMDAASNNGVDNIRELKESIKYPPVKGKYKVYIIDEVHMLSTGAFNALLKTLEEPPEYIKFVLATTEIHKLPATILSRCQRFDFKRISEEDISLRMEQICANISVDIDKKALMLIAKNAEGSARDALSILDQCIPFDGKTISVEDVIEVLGIVKDEFMLNMVDCIINGKTDSVIHLINEVVAEGKDINQFIKDLIYFYRNLLMTKISSDLDKIVPMSKENIERLKKQAEGMSMHSIKNALLELSNTSSYAKYSSQPRILLELAMVKLCTPQMNDSIDGLLERIEQLEKCVASGIRIDTDNKKSGDFSKSKEKEIEKDELPIHKEKESRESHNNHPLDEEKYKSIWDNMILKAREERPSVMMVKEGINIVSIVEGSVILHTEMEVKKEYLLHNKDFIQSILKEILGVEANIQFRGEKEKNRKHNENDDLVKKELEGFFGQGKVNIIE